jgi:glycosyltransferase involved in cell wall biosynthesis
MGSKPVLTAGSVMPQEQPAICILALSAIADDPRVRRQAEAFHRAGWNVTAVGLPGARSPDPEWRILTGEDLLTPRGEAVGCSTTTTARLRMRFRPKSLQSIGRFVRRLPRVLVSGRVRYALRLLAVRVRPAVAQEIYWSFSENIRCIYRCAEQVDAGLWLANDWTMLPLAARLARQKGGVYGYDTHEFAAEEYGDNRKWRLWHRPMVCALERQFIKGAAVVSAVSTGIAERLTKTYRLSGASTVIRNTPHFEPVPFRPTAPSRIRVLYHGIVTPGRGLEVTIDSVADWRSEFDLTIRGPSDRDYLTALRRRISECGLINRVSLAPPVPMTELVREAAAYDVGFFALPGSSRHNQLALPNKFFEYIMAGLALCLTDLPEMTRLVHHYDLGVTFHSVDTDNIAAAINSLKPASIDRYKRNSLEAAGELCWERESERLVGAYGALLGRATTPQAA